MIDAATLPAGPELDLLVAERVMGWTIEGRFITIPRRADGIDQLHWPAQWRPSTDIAHAWEVVERMRALGWILWIGPSPDNGPGWCVQCKPRTQNLHEQTIAETAPLAICRAALAAIAAKVP